ncbi:MAG: DUF1801 domain-containing protein [Flavisolibacter sp.]|nr:DUF1801 domain-containing protein [Flavisolibacter sp.]
MATAKVKFETVEQYISSFPQNVQQVLKEVRTCIRKAVPEAEEVISYQMPAFRFNGWIFYYSAYTNHYSLSCPPPFTVFEKFKTELKPYEVSKSAIKFPLDQPVPKNLIMEMARFRMQENNKKPGKK